MWEEICQLIKKDKEVRSLDIKTQKFPQPYNSPEISTSTIFPVMLKSFLCGMYSNDCAQFFIKGSNMVSSKNYIQEDHCQWECNR